MRCPSFAFSGADQRRALPYVTTLSKLFRPSRPGAGGRTYDSEAWHGYQEAHTEISSDTYHFANTDSNHCNYDTSDEDLRPAKRRKPRSAPAVTPTTSRGHTPELHVGQPGPLVALSTATPEIDDAQPQADDGCPSTFVDHSHHHASRTSRSPFTAAEAVPVAEYQEWPFQGFLKRTRIEDEVTYTLEFRLPPISEHLHLPTNCETLGFCSRDDAQPEPQYRTSHSPIVPSKTRHIKAKARRPTKRNKWTVEEDEILVKMKKDGCSWKEIFNTIPSHPSKAIQVRYYTKLSGGT